MLGRYPYSLVAYAADDTSSGAPPGQILPPPVPGGTTRYFYFDEQGVFPWAYRGLAGGRPQEPYLPGGVVVTPDPAAGVTRLLAWWPYATALLVMRVRADGTREPVRGGYGLEVDDTRTNWATNPSVEAGLNGYVPDAGNPTLTQLTTGTLPAGNAALRATVAAAGSNGVTVPCALTGQALVTVGADVRLSSTPTGLRVVIQWTDATGATLPTSTASVSMDTVVASVGQWSRQVAQITPPAGAVTPTVKIIADGMPAGGQLDLDGITIEQTTRTFTDGSRFDGSVLGASWTGAPHLSTSVLAAVTTILDGECPLDEPVTYIAANAALGGGLVISPPVTLDSGDRAWLTHPSTPDQPFRINLRTKPTLTYKIPQGVFRPIDRRNAVVVSGGRQGAEGTLAFNALSREQRYQLAAALADGQPVLIRAPADYDFDPRWVALADVDHDPEGRLGWQDAWLISADMVEVDPPTVVQ